MIHKYKQHSDSLVAVLYYDPQGENGYYYAAGRHLPSPSIDSEGIKEMVQENQRSTSNSSEQGVDTYTSKGDSPGDHHSETSRAPAMPPDNQEFEYNWTR